MNPFITLAIEGVKTAVALYRSLNDAFSKSEEEREAHNLVLERELADLRGEVKDAAAKSRAKLAELEAVPDPAVTAPDPTAAKPD